MPLQQRLQKIKELNCRSVKLPITHAPLLSITAKRKITKGKGNDKWQQRQC